LHHSCKRSRDPIPCLLVYESGSTWSLTSEATFWLDEEILSSEATALSGSTVHRQQLGTRMRVARPDISHYPGALPEVSSAALASMPLGRHISPNQAARRPERMLSVREAPNRLDPIDRKALALRHLEPLSRPEAAQFLGASQQPWAKRSFRDHKRLGDMLATLPGGLEGL